VTAASSLPDGPAGRAVRRWTRFTPAERIGRSVFYLAALIAIVWSVKTIEVIPEFLYDAPEQTMDLFRRMWPLDWAFWNQMVAEALVETFHTATLGTIIALLLSVPVALMAARNITRSTTLNLFAKFILVSSRSVNSLIWALLFVAVFGPGALAGTLAIAFRSIGFVGKLLAEALEEAQRGPIEALTAAGAPTTSILLKGYWPQVEPSFWSVALFRWDINVRESAVLGLVGAGGIGVALDTALNNLYWDQVGLCLFVIFVVVILTEIATSAIRSRII
jgi:phosphonate transport system permease protein